jgi:hypothetical protein
VSISQAEGRTKLEALFEEDVVESAENYITSIHRSQVIEENDGESIQSIRSYDLVFGTDVFFHLSITHGTGSGFSSTDTYIYKDNDKYYEVNKTGEHIDKDEVSEAYAREYVEEYRDWYIIGKNDYYLDVFDPAGTDGSILFKTRSTNLIIDVIVSNDETSYEFDDKGLLVAKYQRHVTPGFPNDYIEEVTNSITYNTNIATTVPEDIASASV